MAKRRPTQSAKRKVKAQKRSRRQARRKQKDSKPSWVNAIKTKYVKAAGERRKGRRGPGAAEVNPFEAEEAAEGGVEVQDEISEEKMQRLNTAQPLATQLFLKGVPLALPEEALAEFFGQFGAVKRVFIVKNKTTGGSSGSAFVHFSSEAEATSAFEHAQQNAREVSAASRQDMQHETKGMSHHQAKRVAFKFRQGAQQAVDPFVTIGESRVVVHRVLSRVDSQEATSSMIKKRKRTKVAADDPRNLYLLQEGLITRESPAAQGLSEKQLAALENDYNARREQLKSINMFVSKVRLSIRNIPKTETPATLRTLVVKECKKYYRQHPEDLDKTQWGKHGPVRNLKILTDAAGQSKGFGFVEMASHGAALHVLRRLNNNPTVYGTNRRPWVSFAIENVNAVQKLEQIRAARRSKAGSWNGYEDQQNGYEEQQGRQQQQQETAQRGARKRYRE